jgi:hypothetical protein
MQISTELACQPPPSALITAFGIVAGIWQSWMHILCEPGLLAIVISLFAARAFPIATRRDVSHKPTYEIDTMNKTEARRETITCRHAYLI